MKNVTINGCRTELEDFFENEFKYYLNDRLNHTPFIVINEENNSVDISVSVKDLLNRFGDKPKTKVLIQWRGKWSSDFFTFSVGDLQKEIDQHN